MNHEPISPTPWKYKVCPSIPGGETDAFITNGTDDFTICGSTHHEKDLKCIVHRVNAYPKLVEFVNRMRKTEIAGDGLDKYSIPKDAEILLTDLREFPRPKG